MSEMVDRLATVLYGGDLRDCYHPEMFRRQARKCIEAMLEPNKSMLKAGAARIAVAPIMDHGPPSIRDVYYEMVRNALMDDGAKDA